MTKVCPELDQYLKSQQQIMSHTPEQFHKYLLVDLPLNYPYETQKISQNDTKLYKFDFLARINALNPHGWTIKQRGVFELDKKNASLEARLNKGKSLFQQRYGNTPDFLTEYISLVAKTGGHDKPVTIQRIAFIQGCIDSYQAFSKRLNFQLLDLQTPVVITPSPWVASKNPRVNFLYLNSIKELKLTNGMNQNTPNSDNDSNQPHYQLRHSSVKYQFEELGSKPKSSRQQQLLLSRQQQLPLVSKPKSKPKEPSSPLQRTTIEPDLFLQQQLQLKSEPYEPYEPTQLSQSSSSTPTTTTTATTYQQLPQRPQAHQQQQNIQIGQTNQTKNMPQPLQTLLLPSQQHNSLQSLSIQAQNQQSQLIQQQQQLQLSQQRLFMNKPSSSDLTPRLLTSQSAVGLYPMSTLNPSNQSTNQLTMTSLNRQSLTANSTSTLSTTGRLSLSHNSPNASLPIQIQQHHQLPHQQLQLNTQSLSFTTNPTLIQTPNGTFHSVNIQQPQQSGLQQLQILQQPQQLLFANQQQSQHQQPQQVFLQPSGQQFAYVQQPQQFQQGQLQQPIKIVQHSQLQLLQQPNLQYLLQQPQQQALSLGSTQHVQQFQQPIQAQTLQKPQSQYLPVFPTHPNQSFPQHPQQPQIQQHQAQQYVTSNGQIIHTIAPIQSGVIRTSGVLDSTEYDHQFNQQSRNRSKSSFR
jgi:hypothetical protein